MIPNDQSAESAIHCWVAFETGVMSPRLQRSWSFFGKILGRCPRLKMRTRLRR